MFEIIRFRLYNYELVMNVCFVVEYSSHHSILHTYGGQASENRRMFHLTRNAKKETSPTHNRDTVMWRARLYDIKESCSLAVQICVHKNFSGL